MVRNALLVVAFCVGAYFLVNAIVTTDRDLVRQDVERLVEVARRGGDDAVEEILASLAEDYRGSGSFTRASIERQLRNYVGGNRIRSLSTGAIKVVWVGDELKIPLLAIHAGTESLSGSLFLTITYGEREGGWKIVSVTRWRQ